jgi:hypothetical protein
MVDDVPTLKFTGVSTTIRTEGAVVTAEPRIQLTALEGRRVNVALRDGSRIDDCQLVSTGRTRVASIWLFANDTDTFVALDDVADTWEASA